MIKFSKLFLLNPAELCISGVRCNFTNIAKIIRVFDFESIAVSFDLEAEGSPLIAFLQEHKVNYSVNPCAGGVKEVFAAVPSSLCETILEKVICEDPENLFLFHLHDPEKWDMFSCCPMDNLVASGISEVGISIAMDEDSLMILMDKYALSPREIFKKIKSLQFD